jgi:hypothetical protein
MSSLRQIRRLLQQTSELGTDRTQDREDEAAKEKTTRLLAAKRKKAKQALQTPVDEEQVVRHQVDSLLFLDRKMAAKDSKKGITSTRIREQHSTQRHIDKSTAKKTLGNTRSSSTELKKGHVRTFKKKIYRKHQEEKRMAKIAKLLKKNFTLKNKSK